MLNKNIKLNFFIFLPLITPIIKPLLKNNKTIFPISVNVRGSLILIKKLIDTIYPFKQIVDAYWYVGRGHKKGKIILTTTY